MRPPPERKSPGANRGSVGLRGGPLQIAYSEPKQKSTAVCAAFEEDADFLTRWGPYYEGGKRDGYAATLLPWHGNWVHYEVAPTWWQAMNRAIELARQTPRCVYVGGSEGGAA